MSRSGRSWRQKKAARFEKSLRDFEKSTTGRIYRGFLQTCELVARTEPVIAARAREAFLQIISDAPETAPLLKRENFTPKPHVTDTETLQLSRDLAAFSECHERLDRLVKDIDDLGRITDDAQRRLAAQEAAIVSGEEQTEGLCGLAKDTLSEPVAANQFSRDADR